MHRGKKRKSEQEGPKRPKSAYLFFYDDECKKIKKSSGDEKISDEMKRNIGKDWKNLPDNEKVKYIEKAKISSDEYAFEKEKLPPKPPKETINTRCSPERVHKMLQNLNPFQKQLVKDIGFGSLLLLKCINLQRDLCLRLVESFNPETETLELDGVNIPISPMDVEYILGLEAHGNDVPTTGSKEEIDEMCQCYGLGNGDISLTMLEKELTNTNLSLYGNEFKVKFVLFVLGALLCPTKKLVSKCSFLYALKDADHINNMNWSKFVFDFFVDGVRKYKAKQQKSVNGCLLFLMIFYFERTTVGRQDAPFLSRRSPRLEAWGNEEVKQILNKLKWNQIPNRKEMLVANDLSKGVLQVRREEHCDQRPFSEPYMEEYSESKIQERLFTVEKAIDSLREKGKEKVFSEWEQKKEMEAISSTLDLESNLHKAEDENEASCRTQSKNLTIISPFTECQSEFVLSYIFDPTLDKSEILVDHWCDFADRSAFFSLREKERIRSDIINTVVSKLTGEQIQKNFGMKDCFLPTYFSKKLLSKNAPRNDVEGSEFFFKFRHYISHFWECNKIYIPMNDNDQHWYLCVINLNSCIIQIWDSLPCPQRNKEREIQVEKMLVYFREIFFREIAMEEKNFRPISSYSFHIIETPPGVPKQENIWDCGLYVIHFMRVGNYAEFKDDSSISHYRENLALELVLDRKNIKRDTIVKKAIKYWRTGPESKLRKAKDEIKKASCSTQLTYTTILPQFNAKFSTTMHNFIFNSELDHSEILADYLYYSARRGTFLYFIYDVARWITFDIINMVVCKLNAEQRSEMIEWFLPADFSRCILCNNAPRNDAVDISDFQNMFNHYISDLRRCEKIYIPINEYDCDCKCEHKCKCECKYKWYLCVINLGLGITQIWDFLPSPENNERRDNQVAKVVNFCDYFFEKIKRPWEDNNHRLAVSHFPIERPRDVPKMPTVYAKNYDYSLNIVYFMQERNYVEFKGDISYYLRNLALELVLYEENTERDTIVKKAIEYKKNGRFIT